MTDTVRHPKLYERPGSNAEKDPDDWVSDGDPMTGAQASYLTTLSEEAGVEPPAEGTSKAEASRRIDEMREKVGL